MEDFGFVPENPAEQTTKNTVTLPTTATDRRFKFYTLTDALIIAPRTDRKLANKIITVIKNTTKIARRTDLEAKKRTIPTTIYDVDDFRLEIENKPDFEHKANYQHPRIVTVIDRKSGKIIDRVTKPFLVARVSSTLFNRDDELTKSKETLTSAKETFKKMIDFQIQNQK